MKIKTKSKIIVVTFIFALLFAGLANAASKPVITANKTYFDINTGLYVLEGNVRIETRGRVITAETAKVNVTGLEVWATGGITFKQDDISFSGGSVYVYGKDKNAKIDGGADYSVPGLSIISDRAEYNWQTKIAVFSGNVKINQDGKTREADTVTYNVIDNAFL